MEERILRKVLLLAAFAAIIVFSCSSVCYAGSYGIVLPDKASRTVQHAGKELGKYISQMTHAHVIASDSAGTAETVFLLDSASSNPAVKALKIQEPKEWANEKCTDAYYLKSAKHDGRNYIVLAGKNDASTLYAVYEYLERYGGCGFFQDGDYVPSKAPTVTGVDFFTSPRFTFRHYRGDLCGGYGLKKFHYMHRNMDDWMPFYDWLAKRRINASDYWPIQSGLRGGLAVEMAFGVKDNDPEPHYTGDFRASWPDGWTWPAEKRTKMLQHRLAYHRMLGIKAMVVCMYGLTPHPFQTQHPELKWVPAGYGHSMIHPEEPAAYEYTKKFYQAIIDLYGTDHLWYDTPYCEFRLDEDMDKGLKLKTEAAMRTCKLYKEVDPETTWVSDSWDFGGLSDLWTPERRKAYLNAIPRDMTYMADACIDLNPLYRQVNYFEGIPWAVGVIHTFQGDDHLHGNLQDLINKVDSAVSDPKSDKLTGYFHLPETHGSNMLFWQLSTELAWNPKGITVDSFLADYTRSRYGDQSFKTMLEVQRAVVKGVYCGNGQKPVYRSYGFSLGEGSLPPTTDSIQWLKKGLELALTEEERQKKNALYENDMVEWTKSYLGHIINYCNTRVQLAFDAGNAAEVRKYAEVSRKALAGIENILSTRPDYYLQNTIDQAMAVPGTNPGTPEMIREHSIFAMYSANDVYEEMRVFYRPRIEKWLDLLKDAAAKGEKKINDGVFAKEITNYALYILQDKWIDGKFEIPASAKFKGTTMEAVRRAMADVEALARHAHYERGWKTKEVLSTECTATPVVKGLEVIAWADGPAKIVEKAGSQAWTLGTKSPSGQAHLYVSVKDSFVYDGSGPATLTVEYFDGEQETVMLHYDSTDDKGEYGGAYKYMRAFDLTNSGQWKTAVILIPDAKLANRQNGGCDFRLYIGEGSLCVRKLTLTPGGAQALPVGVY